MGSLPMRLANSLLDAAALEELEAERVRQQQLFDVLVILAMLGY
jgi:hypothetical protein